MADTPEFRINNPSKKNVDLTLIPSISMFYYILNIKMMSQSLSNFFIELQAAGIIVL